MKADILFSEHQRFKQWWFLMFPIGINILLLIGVFYQIIGGKQFGDKPMSNEELVITTGISILFTILLLNFRLDTQIKNDGIYVRFFPFHLRYKFYPWEELTKCYVRQYSPIAEYGGWGLRYGFFGKGKAYNVSGNKGLQLEFKNNKKLLIGTNKQEELNQILYKTEKYME